VVIEAWIAVIWHSNYQIEPILQNSGQPTEIWMWTIPEQYEDSLPASFRHYFPEIGVLVSYATTAEQIHGVVQTCFDKIGAVLLLLWEPSIWDPDRAKGIVERGGGLVRSAWCRGGGGRVGQVDGTVLHSFAPANCQLLLR
jgi:hypothetical protein